MRKPRKPDPAAIVRLNSGDRGQIIYLVGLFHVGESCFTVMRRVAKRCKGFRTLRPTVRRRTLRIARAAHRRNQCQYAWIDRGLIPDWKEYKRDWTLAGIR